MRLLDAVILSLSVGFFIIGVHQVMTLGIAYAYWLLMLSVILLFWYSIRKKKASAGEDNSKKLPLKNKKKHSGK